MNKYTIQCAYGYVQVTVVNECGMDMNEDRDGSKGGRQCQLLLWQPTMVANGQHQE